MIRKLNVFDNHIREWKTILFMENFMRYSVSEFVLNEYFQQWILQPTFDSNIFWQNFLLENPQKEKEIMSAKEIILRFREDNDSPTPEQMNTVWNKIKLQNNEISENKLVIITPKKRPNWMSIAASILLIISILGTVYYYKIIQKETYQVAFGENREITLPDGSIVKLNANSTLKISTDWSEKNTREVWLNGEAFFTVTKKPNQGNAKFIVHTSKVDVEVLGTEFNVSERDTNTNVTLNSGKIRLNVHNNKDVQSIIMNPGEQVSFSSNSLKINKKEVKPEVVSAWVSNRWMLESTSLQEIATKIEDTFGFEVIITDAQLANERMTGVIMTNNMDEVLEGISTIYSLKIKKEDNKIILGK